MLTGAGHREHFKFGVGADDDSPSLYPNVWSSEKLTETERLVIAPSSAYIDLLRQLLDAVEEPVWLLYVLVVPRGEGRPGRYQSPDPLSRDEVLKFLNQFSEFLEHDGRCHLWMRSESGSSMLVYDRHNLIYAYGNLEAFTSILTQQGLAQIEAGSIAVPDPHSHLYHAQFDGDAKLLLSSMQWHQMPLREQDLR